MCLGKRVAAVPDGERAIRLGRHFDPVSNSVVAAFCFSAERITIFCEYFFGKLVQRYLPLLQPSTESACCAKAEVDRVCCIAALLQKRNQCLLSLGITVWNGREYARNPGLDAIVLVIIANKTVVGLYLLAFRLIGQETGFLRASGSHPRN